MPAQLVRVEPDPRVPERMDAADKSLVHLSVLTLGEIRKGLATLPQGRRRTRLEAWVEVDLRDRASPQPDHGFTQRLRLRGCAGAGPQSVGGLVTPLLRSVLAQRQHGVQSTERE